MTNLPAPSWSRTNPNNRPTELYSPAMMHPQWATSVRHVTMERDTIPVVCAQETASGPKFACSLQLKPCSLFIEVAVLSSRGTLNFQNLQQGSLSNHGSAVQFPPWGPVSVLKYYPTHWFLSPGFGSRRGTVPKRVLPKYQSGSRHWWFWIHCT